MSHLVCYGLVWSGLFCCVLLYVTTGSRVRADVGTTPAALVGAVAFAAFFEAAAEIVPVVDDEVAVGGVEEAGRNQRFTQLGGAAGRELADLGELPVGNAAEGAAAGVVDRPEPEEREGADRLCGVDAEG